MVYTHWCTLSRSICGISCLLGGAGTVSGAEVRLGHGEHPYFSPISHCEVWRRCDVRGRPAAVGDLFKVEGTSNQHNYNSSDIPSS